MNVFANISSALYYGAHWWVASYYGGTTCSNKWDPVVHCCFTLYLSFCFILLWFTFFTHMHLCPCRDHEEEFCQWQQQHLPGTATKQGCDICQRCWMHGEAWPGVDDKWFCPLGQTLPRVSWQRPLPPFWPGFPWVKSSTPEVLRIFLCILFPNLVHLHASLKPETLPELNRLSGSLRTVSASQWSTWQVMCGHHLPSAALLVKGVTCCTCVWIKSCPNNRFGISRLTAIWSNLLPSQSVGLFSLTGQDLQGLWLRSLSPRFFNWRGQELNLWLSACKASALPLN